MACLTIHSRLSHFRLVTCISQATELYIRADADFHSMPVYGGLEAMAQLATLHVRHWLDFRRHAFLLKVNHGSWPGQEKLDGRFRLTAERYGHSSDVCAYRVAARGEGDLRLDADLLIGTKAYDEEFQAEVLAAHYRKMFEELRMRR